MNGQAEFGAPSFSTAGQGGGHPSAGTGPTGASSHDALRGVIGPSGLGGEASLPGMATSSVAESSAGTKMEIGDASTLSMRKLFVGQIPKDMEEPFLFPFFSCLGAVVDLTIIRDKVDMSHQGCAFVTYKTTEAARMAIDQLHDKVRLPNVSRCFFRRQNTSSF